MTKYSMFLRILRKSIFNRKSRMVVAFSAIIIGATVAAAMLSLTFDINSKMNRELRVYGANLAITPVSSTNFISNTDFDNIKKQIPSDSIVGIMPYLFAVGKSNETQFVVAGTDFSQIPQVVPYWQIGDNKVSDFPLPKGNDFAFVGSALGKQLKLKNGDTFSLNIASESGNISQIIHIAGILSTGDSEDNEIIMPIATLQQWTNHPNQISLITASLVGDRQKVDSYAHQINISVPSVTASPILKIAKAEGSVLNKINIFMLLVSITILVIAGLTVMTTMTALTVERQNEIALIKAIGAADRDVLFLFLCELLTLGIIGGAIGYFSGFALAQILGKALFHTFINLRWVVIPVTISISCVMTLTAGLWAVHRALRIEPAIILRGE